MDHAEQIASATWRVSPDLLCFFDADGRFASANPAWEATLGWSADEVIGSQYMDYVHPADNDRSQAALVTLLSGEPVLRFENRFRHRDGSYRWLSWVAVPENDWYFCSARDITQDRERITEIASQKAEADLREQFLAILGHDLRNPLAGLASGISLLERRSDPDKTASIVEQMRSSVARMNELIGNIMDFARVRLGDGIGLELEMHADLGAQLAQVAEEIALVSPDAQCEFTDQSDRPVRCDDSRIQQVLSNLLANAVTHGDLSQPIRIVFATQAERFTLEIANGGGAMSQDARENLFQPFFRGKPEESKQGLGMGLYIVSEIVSAHGGTIDVVSTDEETRFTVSVPG